MQTKLDRLLNRIDPVRTQDQVSARVDEAINSFHARRGVIHQWQDYKAVVTNFFCHVENIVLRIQLPRRPDPDIDWGRCCQLIRQEYGPNGEKAAFELIRTGNEGGLYAVLKSIAAQMINQYAGNEISGRISRYWGNLTVEQKLAASEEYLGKYGFLLPSEITEGSAARIHVNFLKVLEEHPNLIKRMRNIRSTKKF